MGIRDTWRLDVHLKDIQYPLYESECSKGATSREPPHVFPLEHARAGQPRHYQFQTFPLVDSIGADATTKDSASSRQQPAHKRGNPMLTHVMELHPTGLFDMAASHPSRGCNTKMSVTSIPRSTRYFTGIVFESSIRNSTFYASLGVLGSAKQTSSSEVRIR